MNHAEAIIALVKIFKEKNWFPKDYDDIIFNNFCDLLEVLEPQEKELLLELTKRYLWISGNEYDPLLKETLNMVPSKDLNDAKQLYLFPVVKPSDEGKAKSGIGLVYELKGMIPILKNYRHLTTITLDNFEAFNKAPGTKEKELLCFVDDFIGTGETLKQCLDEIGKKMTIDYSKTLIVSISCQKDLYADLRAKGVMIYSKFVVEKGITDYNIQPAIDEKKALMRLMEKSIPGSKHFSLGWQESEAIITLKRTPDNTFPIFWKKFKRNGILFNPPFVRN